MNTVALFTIFAVTLAIGIPIAFTLYFASFAMLLSMKIPTLIMVQRVIGGIEKEPLLCIPFFVLAGSIMSAGGITDRLIHFSNLLVGRFRGALGLVTVVASMFFAGLSGSAVADATSIGSVLVPAMKKEGYDPGFSAAITASAACTGPLIPPSIPMVVLGIICSLSIGKLFLAAAIPGVMLGLALMTGAYIAAVRHGYPKHAPAPLREVLRGLKTNFLAIAMPLFLVLGIALGVVTDSELGVLAALYALIVGVFFYREINTWKKLSDCLKETVLSTGIVLFIMGAASLLTWLLAVSGVPQLLTKAIFAMTTNKAVILILVNIVLLIAGMFIDPIAALLLLAPILIPMGKTIGMDPLHTGTMVVFNLMLGNLTPPVGITLIITTRFAGISLLAAARAVIPYFLLGIVVLGLITAFPWFSLFLPNLVFGH